MFAPSGGAQNALAAADEEGAGDEAEYGGEGDLGFNRITRRKNVHPTIKPKGLMARLLRTVPSDRGPVLDPFMGSGTTMISCLETGHDGIGIEREAEYLEIADARVRHWNTAVAAWDAARIESEHVPTTTESTEVDLNDFLGL
ncbi:MAG: site-specific DNA-methyltransferase [Actinobacteria bacterium]|nr:site-specific DNA-methyltransferase [Actinomycetota bacterium]NBR67784.1 site-specific DNA-methyltransferase [Actinomycetota bacterium]